MPDLPPLPEKPDYLPALLKSFLLTFPPLLLLLLLVAGALDNTDAQARRRSFEKQESISINQLHKLIISDIRAIVADLQILADHYHLHAGHEEHKEHDEIATIAEEFRLFSLHKKIYDQVRFLDKHGMEIIRINYNAGTPSIVPPEALQDKSRRYYFPETISLYPGEIFVSPCDLNIEHDAIEQPSKPMIRFGAPVFDRSGKPFGIVMLNYYAQYLFDILAGAKEIAAGQIMLVNREGYWLEAPSPDDEWGFMFPGKKERTFARRFPIAWEQISANDSGQFSDKDGMFTFVTIMPFSEGLLASTASPEAFAASSQRLKSDAYTWKIISFVPAQELSQHLHPYRAVSLLMTFALALLLGLGCWIAAGRKAERAVTELQIKKMATHDSLTGLPNRNLLFDRLNQALVRARRDRTRTGVLFLDLDRFKEINDSLGHDAGDLVLQTTARRMTQQLREEDTVARVGGDEFVIIIQDLHEGSETTAIAEKLLSAIQAPICLEKDGKRLERVIGASIGISIFPDHGSEAGILISRADNAMYRSKQTGRNIATMA